MFIENKKRRFNSINDVKRFIASLLNKAKSKQLKEIEIKQFRALIYACNTLADIIKNNDFEDRLNKLENYIKGVKNE